MKSHDPESFAPASYSQAIEVAGPLLFISGQVPRPPQGGEAADTAEAQFRQVFSNLSEILAAAGSGFEQVIQLRAFLSSREHWKAFKAVREEFLGSHRPSITAVVCELADPSWAVEIEAIASLA